MWSSAVDAKCTLTSSVRTGGAARPGQPGDRVEGSSVRAFSPVPGVDFVLTVVGRTLTPVVLKLNSGQCLEACGVLEGLWAAPRLRRSAEEAAAAPLVETMLRLSGRHLMDGKQLLVIGAGGVSKKFVWEAARDYGLKVVGARPKSCSDWWERAVNEWDQFFRPEWPPPGGGSSWRGAGPASVREAPLGKKQRKRRGGINRLESAGDWRYFRPSEELTSLFILFIFERESHYIVLVDWNSQCKSG